MRIQDGPLVIREAVPLEDAEQEALVRRLVRAGIPHFAVPNGGQRNKVTAVRLKRQGVSRGVPDLVLPGSDSRWRCLALELKRTRGGVVDDAQQDWHGVLRSCGWVVLVCYGCDDAVRQLAGLGIVV